MSNFLQLIGVFFFTACKRQKGYKKSINSNLIEDKVSFLWKSCSLTHNWKQVTCWRKKKGM